MSYTYFLPLLFFGTRPMSFGIKSIPPSLYYKARLINKISRIWDHYIPKITSSTTTVEVVFKIPYILSL